MKKNKVTFDQFFKDIYQERWEIIKSALLKENQKAMVSSFEEIDSEFSWIPNSLILNELNRHKIAEANSFGKKKFYVMDPASILVANSLLVSSGDRILDMCSAPGGKGLILASKVGPGGEMIFNEISKNRREKLKKVIRDYIPDEQRPSVHLKGKDGIRYGVTEENSFDGILVDAPCSGERHLLENKEELLTWGPKRTQRLSSIQYGLLCSALLAVKPGKQIVYSTCTISPVENDEVIKKILLKKSNDISLDLPVLSENLPSAFIEKTEFGYIFMPDRCGFGPLYLSRLKKREINE